MSYPSVDKLQNVLARDVFADRQDAKKAAGRALGTLVEIVTFYFLKAWGFERHISIETPLPEYANADITHNVEYSLHPIRSSQTVILKEGKLPITPAKLCKLCGDMAGCTNCAPKASQLLSSGLVVRNSCVLRDLGDLVCTAYLDSFAPNEQRITTVLLQRKPFAIFECKRVGIEEGCKKGPQTIEKAKQGAYVARTVSGLQKIRFANGRIGGFVQYPNGRVEHGDYYELLARIIAGNDPGALANLILTVGVVSNHGNWFTSENHNKELRVLAQSYDWLLFLTDAGIAQFVEDVLLHPDSTMRPARDAFLLSYKQGKKANQFTKVQMALAADAAIQSYYRERMRTIEGWFNVISPSRKRLSVLKDELTTLKAKDWQEIHHDCR